MKHFTFIATVLSLFFLTCKTDQPVEDQIEELGLLIPESALPEYEKNIDHKLLISQLDEEAEHRGLNIYKTICYNCHGDPGQPGSLPTSTKFWSAEFKHGNDPYSIYETLSRGYNLMPPQLQLVPRQKYDVIHFIRENFIAGKNPGQYFDIDEDYLASLPDGSIEGPAASEHQPWVEMDYSNFLIRTYELADSTEPPREISRGPSPLANENLIDQNFAYKGIAIRLDEGGGGITKGEAFVLFDTDLMRLAGTWTGKGFIDYQAILMNERHNIYPRTVGHVNFETKVRPGWANPATGQYDDPRFAAVDGRQFGPLPHEWTQYKGLYYHDGEVVLRYTVGNTDVLERFGALKEEDSFIFSRTLNLSNVDKELKLRLSDTPVNVVTNNQERVQIRNRGTFTEAIIAPGPALNFTLFMSESSQNEITAPANTIINEDLSQMTKGSPSLYDEILETQVITTNSDEAYTADILSLPLNNPWKARVRPTGIDFIPGTDEAVVCTIDGDVWIVGNITGSDKLTWHRIATGLFQPLGIVYHENQIYVTCRDALVRLIDLNGDRETDYYEAFNTDHQVTEHFHEFAMGLQVDEEGNFYYAKSARHARDKLIPQHGTLIKISPDGKESTILARGFRAANGVCRNPDGSFYVTDQEGYWNPMNRINHVTEGGFYGNMYGWGAPEDTSDAAMIQPLCWIDMRYDRSPSELLWVQSNQWGPLNGRLLNISYGYGKVFLVLQEEVNGVKQGGIVQLPLPQFPSGLVRGRFHPKDGQLYAGAMTAWATSQVLQAGGLYRIRYTGNDLSVPVQIKTKGRQVQIEFVHQLDQSTAEDPSSYEVHTWQLKRTHRYGSKRYDEKELEVTSVDYNGNIVTLNIPGLEPTWIIEINYNLRSKSGKEMKGAYQGTIYELEEEVM